MNPQDGTMSFAISVVTSFMKLLQFCVCCVYIYFLNHFLSSSQVNGWDMTMVTHDNARKKLTKKKEDVVRLLVTRKSLEEAVKNSKGSYSKH